jgi:uncharacterized protein
MKEVHKYKHIVEEVGGYKMALHLYEMNGKKMALDINSGSVHVVDDLTYEALSLSEKLPHDEAIKTLSEKYPNEKESIKEIFGELKELEEQGMLNADDIYGKYANQTMNQTVKALCLHVAHDCNLRCNYCFASQGDYKGCSELMPLEVGKKALDFIVRASKGRRNLDVDFFGGEPLMNWDVVKKLVAYGRELEKEHNKNFRFTITTNGVLLDEEKIDFINENMHNVVLSLDGRKEVNDKMRPTPNGKGSYDTIVPKFQRLIEKRGQREYFIRGTFTRYNLDFAEDVKHYKDLGFDITSLEPVVTDPKMDYAIREEDLDTVLNEYEKLSAMYIDMKKENPNFTFYHFVADLNQGPCVIRKITGCGAGSSYLAVTPKGDLYPCHQFVDNPDFKLGDVETGVVKTELVEDFSKVNDYSKPECSDCWAKFYCSGGCMANAFHANGDVTKPYKVGCEMEKKRIECALSVAANLEGDE